MSRNDDEFVGHASYSPDFIYGRMEDIKHSGHVRGVHGDLRADIGLIVMVNEIVAELPHLYKSVAAFHRDAIHHRAQYLKGQLSEATSDIIKRNEATARLYTLMAQEQEWQKTYDQVRQAMMNTPSAETRIMLQLEASQVADTIPNEEWAKRFRDLH